ncbi:protein FAR1-RELATED SEQUENCE 2, partial [Carica papaya]|uniref:protein FAR1-RELATED SEQUENCE 2 n=1 Tax=Carica papaya TaxID=3649 RepID=UPI000B8CDE41
MEIDLEIPSHEQKLDDRSNANEIHGIDIENKDLNLPSRSENVKEACQLDKNKSIPVYGEQVDFSNDGTSFVNKGLICEPQNGLEFDSKEAAYSFYREYARAVGFGITIKASRRSKKSGKFIDVKISCSRFGSKSESSTTVNPRSCPKTGCKAGMHIKRRQDEKWIVHNFLKEHNHEICQDDFYYALKGRNKQSGIISCQKKGLQLYLDDGDVQAMLEHFMCMQDKNPGFFYAIDFDSDKQVKNVLWVDAKSRHDYSNFSDVVFFDTFYVRSNYKIPYAPFIGVNHHCQYILLGCTLIGDESASSFTWLMRTWLKAMGGQAPEVILTDQDKCLKEVIEEVFPNTRHCFCLWNIVSKIPENFGLHCNHDESFMAKFNKCINRSGTDEQFERRWWKMVGRFELKENEWMHSIYEDRKKWVPTYMRNTFLAGMSTAERSASIASFFDKCIHKDAKFKDLIEQHKTFLQDRYDMEVNADLEMRNKRPALRSFSPFEKQVSTIYTETVFKKFQVEVLGAVSCQVRKESEDGPTVVFHVDDFEEREHFLVTWNESQLELCCLCHSFEYRGFLCKHAILVLQISGVSDIPSHYILKRWTIDANVKKKNNERSGRLHFRVERFNDLCKRAIKLGEVASFSHEAYSIAFQALEEALKHCVGVNNSVRSVLEPSTLADHGCLDIGQENNSNIGTKFSKKKKIHKKRKLQSEPVGITNRPEDGCQQMEQMYSRAHTLDNSYAPQQDMQAVELGSREANLDSYYGSQQNLQRVGQLNSVSPYVM